MEMYNFNNEKLQHYKMITDKLTMSTDNKQYNNTDVEPNFGSKIRFA